MTLKRGGVLCAFCCLLLNARSETEIFQAKLVAFEPEGGKVVLQRKGGPETRASLYKKARYWLRKSAVAADQFQQAVGSTVMVRMSIQSGAAPVVREMADMESWKWLEIVRKGVQRGKIATLEDDLLILQLDDGKQFAYRVTPKTQWQRNNQPASFNDFQEGEIVYVAPRLLSNLETMVTAVCDTKQGAEIQKERLMPTVSGTLQTLDREAHILRVHSKAGDLREFQFDSKTQFVENGKKLPVEKVKVPSNVTVHRRKESDGSDYATRVTIYPPSKASPQPRPATPKKP